MRILSSHITVGFTNLIYGDTHNSYEIEKYAFMVLSKYSIIFRL